MHNRAGGGDEHAPREGGLTETSGFVGFVDVFHRRHANDADVAAEGNPLDPEFGVADLFRPQTRSETREEFRGPHARPLGRREVAELVEHDHHQNCNDDDRQSPAPEIEQSPHDDREAEE